MALHAEAKGSRARYQLAGTVADRLAYCAPRRPASISESAWPSKLHLQAEAFLVHAGVCKNETQARAQLLEIGIGDPFAMRCARDTDVLPRFRTKNAEDQARFRGKAEYLKHWVLACADAGVLTRALFDTATSSRTLAAKVLAATPGMQLWSSPQEVAASEPPLSAALLKPKTELP